MQKKSLLAAALTPLLWACGDSTGPEDGGQVAVRFAAVAGAAASGTAASGSAAAAGPITLTGTNGVLVIEDIRLIVSEIELEREDDACEGVEDDDDCEEFEGGPFLVNLLDGTGQDVVSAAIPAGRYTELEFEVEDLDLDDDEDDDDGEQSAKQAILIQLRQAYPGFPADASMVVRGTFDGQPFTVYFEAEIEVEREFASPFRVPEDGTILVFLDPAAWFQEGTRVIDLHALDGRTVEFEAEFKSGISIDKDD